MAVLDAELILYKSDLNYGGDITATVATGGNVFPAFSGDETAAGRTEYACIYAKNTSAQTCFGAKVFVSAESTHGTVNATIALGNAAVNGTESSSGGETTAPSPALTFVEADGEGNALSIGDLLAGEYQAFWVKLVVPAGTTAAAYSITIDFGGDTEV